MKKLAVLFTLLCSIFMFSQNFYEMKWKLVAENYQKGLYKSNLPIILDIQKQATKEGNSVELIRSLKAEFSIINQTRDDTQNNTTTQFFNKISGVGAQLKGDDQLLFQALKGEFISDYYQQNSWRINGRTNVLTQTLSKGEDLIEIETWSKQDYKNYLSKNFLELNKRKSELQKTMLSKYEKIFEGTEYLQYFPSLQDWSSMNEIDFLKHNQLFTPNELKENQPKIKKIFDELVKNNSGNAKLYFQHQKLNTVCGFNNCKDRFEQLEKLVEEMSTNGDYKVIIIADIMQILNARKDYRLALTWANDAKEIFPKSEFLNNIINLENQITTPSLQIHYEENTLPNQPIHIEANAKNTNAFSLAIYEVKDDFQNFLEYVRNSYDKKKFEIIKKKLVREENYVLPKFTDYKNHQTSLEIKPLPAGIYVVEYKIDGKKVDDYYFVVSQTRIITEKDNSYNKKESVMKLVDRNTGKSFANENLVFHKFNNGKPSIKSTTKTDKNGNFNYPEPSLSEYYNFYLVEQPSTNSFEVVNFYTDRNNYDRNNDKPKYATQIFIDRGIYRPGQIVYFKVINTKLQDDKESVIAGITQLIYLNDANGEKITAQKLTTNEFGSYHGSFTLPNGKLNGQFSLEVDSDDLDDSGYKYFQVEEYKRPKFEVTFEPIKDEYKYGQTLEIKGTAKMFSGIALSNSVVNYEIKKQNIRWRYFYWYPRGNDNQNSILGAVKTDEKGEFTIKLKLEKDETLEGIQIDNYQINASVTDINGETQSANTDLKVASVSHYISIDNASTSLSVTDYFTDKKIEFKVSTKNYNDQNLKKSYHAKLSKLKGDERIYRDNFKNQIQDSPQFSKAEFVQKFPHDYFSEEELKDKVEKVVFDRLEQPKTPTNNLDLGKLNAGKYKLELYNIEGNDSIKTDKFFEVFDKRFLVDNQKPFLKVVSEKSDYKRSEIGKIYVYSAIPDALVNVFVQNGDGETSTEQRKLKNGLMIYEAKFPNDEKVNKINVQFQLVAYNDVQLETVVLDIKEETQALKIETVTFRDKLEPNVKEKWTIKILGDEKEKIQAEVLANMYDKSLDKFAINRFSWQKLNNISYYFEDYNVRNNLLQKNYQKRMEYLANRSVRMPNFNWNDYQFFQKLMIQYKDESENYPDNDGDGVLDKDDACPTVPGTSQFNGCPKPMTRTAEEVSSDELMEEVVIMGYSKVTKSKAATSSTTVSDESDSDGVVDEMDDLSKIKVRQNLNETAFFYPNLVTDKDGNVNFEFTSPEALTQWKVMFLAHTKDARSAYLEKSVITQKEFSVTPNYPRFLREGDELQLQSKLSSLVNKPLSGVAQLQILDPFTNEDISSKFNLNDTQKSFNLKNNGNSVVDWTVKVPENISSIIIKVVAKSSPLNPLSKGEGTSQAQSTFSDGEQKAITVLPNRMLVTEAVPIFVKEGQTKTFSIENLTKNNSTTVTNFSNTLELTTNPIWEVMFALPSLKNDDNQSSDVVFNKWFADVVAAEIFKNNPKLKTIFEEYQAKGLLTSNLEKNQELKQLLLEETPWVLESASEEEQMQKLARLFDANTMKNSIESDWKELQQLQNSDGGFSWYKGYQSSYNNSLYILKNLGKINAWLKGNTADYQNIDQQEMVSKLINYVDNEVSKYWDTSASLSASKENVWDNWTLDYLDSRRYWEKDYPLKGNGKTLKDLVIKRSATAKLTDFTFYGLHRAALLFDSYGKKELSQKLLTYLKETSTDTQTQGVYWKQNLNDWGWYTSKTVNHAGAIEAFQQLTPNDVNFVEEMKIWLITQKEVNSWGSSRGTAEVIFTILNSGKSWTSSESDKATIIWGSSSQPSPKEKEQSATGYSKQTIKSANIDKSLGSVTITKPGAGIVQGGLFWQYYEDLDKIKSSESYLSISKELYKKVKTVNGEELQKISGNSPLKIGDKVTVRMILNTDRNMEYIHLKDMRAAGFEPLDVISAYQWKNNLGYYQSTKDASTNFYIQYMPKGKYVFEYDYICNAAGKFSNGITTLQNYYAPQMNANTQGTSVEILEQ